MLTDNSGRMGNSDVTRSGKVGRQTTHNPVLNRPEQGNALTSSAVAP